MYIKNLVTDTSPTVRVTIGLIFLPFRSQRRGYLKYKVNSLCSYNVYFIIWYLACYRPFLERIIDCEWSDCSVNFRSFRVSDLFHPTSTQPQTVLVRWVEVRSQKKEGNNILDLILIHRIWHFRSIQLLSFYLPKLISFFLIPSATLNLHSHLFFPSFVLLGWSLLVCKIGVLSVLVDLFELSGYNPLPLFSPTSLSFHTLSLNLNYTI